MYKRENPTSYSLTFQFLFPDIYPTSPFLVFTIAIQISCEIWIMSSSYYNLSRQVAQFITAIFGIDVIDVSLGMFNKVVIVLESIKICLTFPRYRLR